VARRAAPGRRAARRGAADPGTEGQLGKILAPDQVKAMYDSGFEWGEYLGLQTPWEQLKPPPPR
jgi:hypothetical protein